MYNGDHKYYNNQTDWIEIEYFTDPLCCWSWVFEPQWRLFLNEVKIPLKWKYRMGGLIPEWNKFRDPSNDVYKPSQIIPYWIQVSRYTGTPIDEGIWNDDPPQSSYPACIAVKCAQMQSFIAADVYLQRLREAVMIKRKNICKREVLLGIAEKIDKSIPGLINTDQFESDLFENKSRLLFKEDLQRAINLNIERFPTLLMHKPFQEKSILISGYRPFNTLIETVAQLTRNFAGH